MPGLLACARHGLLKPQNTNPSTPRGAWGPTLGPLGWHPRPGWMRLAALLAGAAVAPASKEILSVFVTVFGPRLAPDGQVFGVYMSPITGTDTQMRKHHRFSTYWNCNRKLNMKIYLGPGAWMWQC